MEEKAPDHIEVENARNDKEELVRCLCTIVNVENMARFCNLCKKPEM